MCIPKCPYCLSGKQFNFSDMSLDFLKERYNFLKLSLGEIARSLSQETDREAKSNLETGQSAQRSEFCEIQDELYLRGELH
ncbi:MAG: hypothetical protein ACOYL8_04930 [Patescibacteria group bacterium]